VISEPVYEELVAEVDANLERAPYDGEEAQA
jgi:hypothetical protein